MADSADQYHNIEDRGRAEHFHGRQEILGNFHRRLNRVKKDARKGTTFLIQAAPGAGKTALLAECARIAAAGQFAVAAVDPYKILNPRVLHKSIHKSWKNWRRWLAQGKVGIDIGLLTAEVAGGGAAETSLDVIESGKGGLLLLLDEAQSLDDLAAGKGIPFMGAKSMLTAIHNGEADRPVILLAAGLSATKQVFSDLKISRFKAGCYVELGPLSTKEERKVIKDWLTQDGGAEGDTTMWIDAIAAETYGWPQHVATYAQIAALQVQRDKGKMTSTGLQAVLKAGRLERTKFYESRADGLQEHHRKAIAHAFAEVREDHTQTGLVIMRQLTEAVGEAKADTVFKFALHKGVLDFRNGRYAIPIPSMRDWFLENYF